MQAATATIVDSLRLDEVPIASVKYSILKVGVIFY